MSCILEDQLQLPLYHTSISPKFLLRVLSPSGGESAYTNFKGGQLKSSSLEALGQVLARSHKFSIIL